MRHKLASLICACLIGATLGACTPTPTALPEDFNADFAF